MIIPKQLKIGHSKQRLLDIQDNYDWTFKEFRFEISNQCLLNNEDVIFKTMTSGHSKQPGLNIQNNGN